MTTLEKELPTLDSSFYLFQIHAIMNLQLKIKGIIKWLQI